MRMYKSPIEIIYTQMQNQAEGDIFRAVQSYGINVDKEELLRALRYDREQYHKGYADGASDAMESIVRCKDCKHYNQTMNECESLHFWFSEDGGLNVKEDDFCSYGEKREV
jgi:hypothetical protein